MPQIFPVFLKLENNKIRFFGCFCKKMKFNKPQFVTVYCELIKSNKSDIQELT